MQSQQIIISRNLERPQIDITHVEEFIDENCGYKYIPTIIDFLLKFEQGLSMCF